jgi:hypothetical protein
MYDTVERMTVKMMLLPKLSQVFVLFHVYIFGLFCGELICHTRFSEESQVQTYMHARIKFHAYSDI